jgi:hypothetical protein
MLAHALAEACTIDDAGSRAAALARLCTYLPDRDDGPVAVLNRHRAVDLALADARADGRVTPYALTVAAMAPLMPRSERLERLSRAWQAAGELPDPVDRAAVWTALVPLQVGSGRGQAIDHACTAAENITDPGLQRDALSALAATAPDTLRRQAERVAVAVETISRFAEKLKAALAAGGIDAGHQVRVLPALLAAPERIMSADGQGPLPSETPRPLRTEVADATRNFVSAISRLHRSVSALAVMTADDFSSPATTSPAAGAASALVRARSTAQTLRPDPDMPPELLPAELLSALRLIEEVSAQTAGRPKSRPRPKSSAAPDGDTAPSITDSASQAGRFSSWAPGWRMVIEEATGGGRAALLSDLPAVSAAVNHFGGSEAVQEMILALLDVGRWWP